MPPREGQLDHISEVIGELKSSMKATERYVHDWRHATNNLAAKVDGLGAEISRQIAATEARIGIRLDSMDRRISALEKDKDHRDGAVSVGQWFMRNGASLGAMLVGAIIVVIIMLKVSGQLP